MDWVKLEPIRTAIYAVLVPIAAVLVYKGVIDGAEAGFYLAIAAGVLGVGVAAEVARSQVFPKTKVVAALESPGDINPVAGPAATTTLEGKMVVVTPLRSMDSL